MWEFYCRVCVCLCVGYRIFTERCVSFRCSLEGVSQSVLSGHRCTLLYSVSSVNDLHYKNLIMILIWVFSSFQIFSTSAINVKNYFIAVLNYSLGGTIICLVAEEAAGTTSALCCCCPTGPIWAAAATAHWRKPDRGNQIWSRSGLFSASSVREQEAYRHTLKPDAPQAVRRARHSQNRHHVRVNQMFWYALSSLRLQSIRQTTPSAADTERYA